MQDPPSARDLVDAVAGFVRDHALPALEGHTAFHARVALNVLEIVGRELALAGPANEAERRRLVSLLGRDGSLEQLNAELCERLARGEVTLATPGLSEHLWETTLAKLAIDQPGYAAYRRALGAGATGSNPGREHSR